MNRSHLVLLMLVSLIFLWSGINPYDRFTWILEVFPAVIGLAALALTYRRFPLTTFSYTLIAIHMVILMIGGHYTYAKVPFFDWLRDSFDLGRNHYDRLGHLAQGFIPAILAREILLRLSPLRRGGFLSLLIPCVCLAISAFYELIEWWVALATGTAAEAFLGTQGDVWDTQSDMAMALLGSLLALLTLSNRHDKAMAVLAEGREKG
ncbi:putative membrane protein [Heliobacterium gestii]|nr:putative membrane protein [Heliomicrobium gestii]